MGKWLIGCAVLALLVIGLLAVAGFFVFREIGDIGESMKEANDRLDRIAQEHPFERPEDGLLDRDRVVLFLDARGKLATWVDEFATSMQEGSVFKKIRSAVGFIQDALPVFATALEEAGMSRNEYEFIAEEAAYVFQYAGRKEVAAEFPQLIEAREARDEALQTVENIDIDSQESGGDGGISPLTSIDPYRLDVPRHNVEIVASLADRFRETAKATAFEEFLLQGAAGE